MKATQVLSLLLTAAMLLAILPLGVWAETAVSDFTYTITDGEATITGYIGEGGDVVIPSEIEGYPVTSIGDEAFSWCESLTSVVIPDSVTSIGEEAFYNCSLLTSIVIPNSVMSIGFEAFASCDLLTDIYCEAEVQPEGWDEKWYLNCTATIWFNGEKYEKPKYFYEIKNKSVSITGYSGNDGDIVIPNEIEGYPVKSIGKNAFANCELLTSVVIPDSVTSIEGYAFYNCYSLTSISIPNSVTSIGAWAFTSCYSLTSIVIPDGVTSIGHNAFYWCSSLSYIDLSDSVTSIGSDAFYHCTSLSSVDLPNTVTYIDYSVFSQCTSLTDIYCEAETQPESWNEEWLDGCYATVHWGACMHRDTAKTEITTDATCTQDGVKYSICDACGEILSDIEIIAEATGHDGGEDGVCLICHTNIFFEYIIENGEVTITGYTGNGGLVVIPSEIEGYPVLSIGQDAFSFNDTISAVVISNGIRYIGAEAFEDCHYLQSILIPDSVVSIDSYAFGWCYELSEITIPASVTDIGYAIFHSNSAMQSIYCETSSQPEGWNSDWDWLYACDATVYWNSCAHRDTAKTEITTEATCARAGIKYLQCDACGRACAALEIVSEAIGHTLDESGACSTCKKNLFYKYEIENGKVTITDYVGEGSDVIIPSEIEGYPVTSIGADAFYDIDSLISIVIPDSVTSIGASAFSNCDSLTSIAIPDSVTSIGVGAFHGCDSLTSIAIPDSVTSIGASAFSNCDSLTSVSLPSSITTIGFNMFYYCTSLKSIVIPDGVTTIAAEAFCYCQELESVIFPDSLTTIGRFAFSGCSSLNVSIPQTVRYIGYHAFSEAKEVHCAVAERPKTWDPEWFAGFHYDDCSTVYFDGNLTVGMLDNLYYSIDNGEVTIHNYLGEEPDLVIPSEINGYPVTRIVEDAFDYFDTLRNLSIPGSIKTIASFTFSGCGLEHVTLGDGIEKIESYAFNRNRSLTSITIPASVAEMGYCVFSDCTNLETIYYEAEYIPDGWDIRWSEECNAQVYAAGKLVIDDNGEYRFDISKGSVTILNYLGEATELVIPSEIEGYPVTAIGANAFANCDTLTSVTIPSGVQSIANDAFANCDSLTSVSIPAGIAEISEDAFRGSRALETFYFASPIEDGNWFTTWYSTLDSTATVYFGDAIVAGTDEDFRFVINNGETVLLRYFGDQAELKIPSEIHGYPVVEIGAYAFDDCDFLTSITLPASVTKLAKDLFVNCDASLVIYSEADTKPQGWGDYWDLYSPSAVYFNGVLSLGGFGDYRAEIVNGKATLIRYLGEATELTIPTEIEGCSVTAISDYVFAYHHDVKTVYIPACVTEIGSNIFANCYNLTSVFCEAAQPPEGWNPEWCHDCTATIYFDGVSIYGEQNGIRYRIENGSVTIIGYSGDATSVIIPSEINGMPVTAIHGFGGFYTVASVTIPASVQTIKEDVFMGDPERALVAIYCEASSAPAGWDRYWDGEYSPFPTVFWNCCIHKQTINESKEATCLEEGYQRTICSDCGEILSCETIPLTDHNYIYGVCDTCGVINPAVTYGDANGDGEINGLDVTRMMQYFASYDYETDSSDIEISDSADCNGDGVLDGRDVVRLLRYLANRDPLTGKSDVELGK